jgi:hypothetical protein
LEDVAMTPFDLELVRTMHEDQRRRLARRALHTDARVARPKRRRPKL